MISLHAGAFVLFGTPSRTRTWDPLIKNQMPGNPNHTEDEEVTESGSKCMASCVAFLREIRPDLADVVEVWDRLPEAIKAGILAMVKTASKEEE